MKPLLITLALSLLPLAGHAALTDSELQKAREAYIRKDLSSLQGLAANPVGLDAWPAYWQALLALDKQDDGPARRLLGNTRNAYLDIRLLNNLSQYYGKQENWSAVRTVAGNLAYEDQDGETRCYLEAAQLLARQTPKPDTSLWQKVRLSDGCYRLTELHAANGVMSRAQAESRLRLLLASNYRTVGQTFARAANLEQAFFAKDSQEQRLQEILTLARSNLNAAMVKLANSESLLTQAQSGFAWGFIAQRSAQQLNMPQALDSFARADAGQLTDEQWEWWLRAALRQQDWPRLEQLSRSLPEGLQEDRAWQYWRARSLLALGRQHEATPLLIKASFAHDYYGLLAREELGNAIAEPAQRESTDPKLRKQLETDSDIRLVLALSQLADHSGDAGWREEGRRLWRWKTRSFNDEQLLAAAEIALDNQLYDMAIQAAERTVRVHDFNLRYLTPYRDVTRRYASELGIDEAWVYGLMRQESRFLNVARSGVGASGLMQLMPATARWVAGKLGIKDYAVNHIDTNIQFGTWYLRHVKDSLSGNPVLATAAYNAGPGRARNWQTALPLEGAIYAETIPFTETRDYVQKVMANAVYYNAAFRQGSSSLKVRMGTIPGKG